MWNPFFLPLKFSQALMTKHQEKPLSLLPPKPIHVSLHSLYLPVSLLVAENEVSLFAPRVLTSCFTGDPFDACHLQRCFSINIQYLDFCGSYQVSLTDTQDFNLLKSVSLAPWPFSDTTIIFIFPFAGKFRNRVQWIFFSSSHSLFNLDKLHTTFLGIFFNLF